jgi:hypothetical protein
MKMDTILTHVCLGIEEVWQHWMTYVLEGKLKISRRTIIPTVVTSASIVIWGFGFPTLDNHISVLRHIQHVHNRLSLFLQNVSGQRSVE